MRQKRKNKERKRWWFWRYNGSSKPIAGIPRFRYVGLAIVQHRQNFGMQGGKGGDFSVVFPKNTTRTLRGEKPFSAKQKNPWKKGFFLLVLKGFELVFSYIYTYRNNKILQNRLEALIRLA